MAKLIWNGDSKHKMEMTRDHVKEVRTFYYWPICGFYRYHDGNEGYDNRFIWNNFGDLDFNNSEKYDKTYTIYVQCRGDCLEPIEGEKWNIY